jgi:hypothetical protein
MPTMKWRVSSTGLLEVHPRTLNEIRRVESVDERGRRARALFTAVRSRAEHGDPIAVLNVALCYLWGIGVACNLSLSILWSVSAENALERDRPGRHRR